MIDAGNFLRQFESLSARFGHVFGDHFALHSDHRWNRDQLEQILSAVIRNKKTVLVIKRGEMSPICR
jgi:hypothetical protein